MTAAFKYSFKKETAILFSIAVSSLKEQYCPSKCL